MKNTQHNTYHIREILSHKLGIRFEATKETNGAFYRDGIKIFKVSVPKGRKFLPEGTYAAISRQLKISIAQFDALLDCPLKLEDYLEILKTKNVIPPKDVIDMAEVKKLIQQTRSRYRR